MMTNSPSCCRIPFAKKNVKLLANGELTLQGFSGSAVSSLILRVDNYAALKNLVQNHYSGRLVDVLDVKLS